MRPLAFALFLMMSLVNCGDGSVTERTEDAWHETVVGSNGECKPGETKRSEDGCNTCRCSSNGWSCTKKGCDPRIERPEGRDCVAALPPELEARIQAAYTENQKARDEAVEAERNRLEVTPMMPGQLLGLMYDSSQNVFKPETDPFPQSVVAVGTPHDIRTEGYEINHGKMGMTRVYETAPGSKKYFIVDRIGGDGVGGNGKAVVEESFAYALLALKKQSDPLQGSSWHSWHVSADNKLVRATQLPTDELQAESRICGCGPLGYEEDAESSAAGDMAPPVYNMAIFMLPGDALPEILPEDGFQAKFVRKYFKKIYVPRPGKVCRKHDVVC